MKELPGGVKLKIGDGSTSWNSLGYVGEGQYLPLSGGTLTGDLTFSNFGIISSSAKPGSIVDFKIGSTGGYGGVITFVTTRYPDGVCYITDAAGNPASAGLYMNGYGIYNLRTPVSDTAAANKRYVDDQVATNQTQLNNKLPLSGGTMAGNINMNNHDITGIKSITSQGNWTTVNFSTQANEIYTESALQCAGLNVTSGITCGTQLAFESNTSYPHIYAISGNILTLAPSNSEEYEIVLQGNQFRPGSDNEQICGRSNNRWSTIYAVNGTIQTSDRSEKSDIHYIKDSTTSIMKTLSLNADTTDNDNKYEYSYDNLLEFIDKLNPVVFSYGKDGIDASLSDNHMDQTQLGLIADDIQDEELFKFVGASIEDDEGKTHLGLKAVPLAVLALSACKNLLQRVKYLESK